MAGHRLDERPRLSVELIFESAGKARGFWPRLSITPIHRFHFFVHRACGACAYYSSLTEFNMNTSHLSIFSRRMALIGGATAALLLATACSHMGGAPAQSVRIVAPADGATVGTTFMVKFGVKGLEVAPAGDIVAGSGHHHLLINLDSIVSGESIPFTDKHIHFGKGQTEAEVKLAPGNYTLTAQFANGAHQSYGKALSHSIKVTVK